MTKCVIIEKGGDLKEKIIRDFDIKNLYKKCLLQNDKNFECRHTWELKTDEFISIFAKNSGRAGSENKYDLPPPLDNSEILFFGKLALIKHSEQNLTNENVLDLVTQDWETLYEKLFGGFESLGEEEASEEEIIPKELRSKHGYLKDGFVVDSDDSDLESIHESDLSDDENEDENEDEIIDDNDGESVDAHVDVVEFSDDDFSDIESEESSEEDGGFGSELSEESYISD